MCKHFTAGIAGVLNLLAVKGNQDDNVSAEEKNVERYRALLGSSRFIYHLGLLS